MTTPPVLPEEFRYLQPFVSKWAVATEVGRNRVRRHSSMPQIREFYNVIVPRLDAVIIYLNRFPLDDMPAPARLLLRLALSAMEIAPAVELYRQPDVVHAFDAERVEILVDPVL